MSRTQSSPRPFGLTAFVSPQVIAIGMAVVTAGCSSDITRFDTPMFGLTETRSRHASAPTPRVGMNGGMALGDAGQSYGGSYTPPSPTYSNNSYGSNSYGGGNAYRGNSYAGSDNVTVASLPDPEPRPSYSSQGGVTGYQGSQQYQQSYQPPSQQSYQPSQAYAPSSVPPAYPQSSAPQSSFGSDNDYGSRSTASRSPSRSSGSSASHDNTVEVEPGDTLYSIAQRHRVSISELMSVNSLSSPTLQPGQRLMLPAAPSRTAAAVRGRSQARSQTAARAPERPSENTYAATPTPLPQPGSQYSAAAEETTPYADAEPATVAATEEHTGETYTLKRGDNLYGIAVRHRVSVAELQRVNGITDPRRLKPGMVLKIPGSASASTAVAEAAPAPRQTRVAEVARPAAPAAEPVSAGASEASPRPVIINAQQPQQVASLGSSGQTATDASPMSSEAVAAIAAPDPAPAQKTPALERSSEPAAQGKFRWPVQGRIIAGFGKGADGTQSDGIKLAVPMGTDVHAAEGGVVAYAGSELKGYGNLVLLRHDNGWITAYAHNEELSVKRGDRVRRGQVIAKAGKSGNADSPQVHFELRQGSSPVDPLPHLEKL